MNCFLMRNHFIDLSRGGKNAEAEAHAQSCNACKKKITHLQECRSLIKRLPKHSLVPELKTAEETYLTDDAIEDQRKNRFFDQSPWYVKSGIEAVILALMTIGIIWGIPKVRQLYDRSTQRRLETIDLNDLNSSNEFDGSATATQAIGPEIKASENEVWRINIKTDNIHEIQTRLLNAIKSEHSVDSRDAVSGVLAPGGVQIEFNASIEFIQHFKDEINDIAKSIEKENAQPSNSSGKGAKPRSSGLTWYKSKSKVKLPKDRIKVVIWLSQM